MPRSRYRGVKTLLMEGPVSAMALRQAPSPVQDNLDRPASAPCAAFLDHWLAIRDGRLVPTVTRFCESAAATFAPASTIVELQDNMAPVRYQGAALIERWGADITGQDLYRTFPYYSRVRALANVTKVATLPCGYFGINRLTLPKKGEVTSSFIQLPLLSADGAAIYVVHFSAAEPGAGAAGAARYYQTRGTGWIDIGAGVPARRPYLLDAPRAAAG